ncbi:tetratricopeptide repeat protein [Rufibacter sediminis]|uniref:Tetratricopeptide repeat protein n=1 Tax=Rufibacter sediminis TaxID=2762756 RepID=A0ABR6VX51_9BACT|nr:tetratricopeptide repeat protein [Rufibacter sediminis]MBC3541773.1 tetratricopeptide repeat protein [Rufibacter sediminis]
MPASTNSVAKIRIKELTQLIKQQPGNAQAYAERADAKMEMRDVYSAIKDYSIALTIASATNTDHAAARVGRGNAFLEVGAYREALKDFEAVLAKDSSTEALYGRAVARYYLDDYFGAIRDLDEVVAADPSHSKALCNRGIVKLELNQLEDAIADLTLFLAHHPTHPEAAYSLSVATNRLQKRIGKRSM